MANHLVINLADKDGEVSGPTAMLMQGLTYRRTKNVFTKLYYLSSSIEKVEATKLLQDDLVGKLSRSSNAVVELRRKCAAASRIYVATHGTPSDTDHCFLSASGGQPLCTYKQLASFLLLLLPQSSKTYYIGLVMCYAARCARARSTDVDHEGQIDKSDLKTSFAYRVFREVCTLRNVRMTARTGAVGMDGPSGKMTVEEELAVDAHLDKTDLIQQMNPTALIADYKQAQTAICKIDGGTSFVAITDLLKKNPDAVINTPIGAPNDFDQHLNALRAQYRYEARRKQFQDIIQSKGNAHKYGKFMYDYKGSTLTVTNVYGSSKLGAGSKIYEGSLL